MDWLELLNAHGIEYQTSGPNVSRGNVAVRCPFCSDDPSFHMSISLTGHGWYCWRDTAHRGTSPTRLIQALLSCSWEQARALTGSTSPALPQDFAASVRDKLEPKIPPVDQTPIKLPPQFRPLTDRYPAARHYLAYMSRRGFAGFIPELHRYDLHYCTQGPFQGRIIFPVTFNQQLVTWTGRTIYHTQDLRYRTLSPDPDKAAYDELPPAIGPIKSYLLFWDRLRGDTICLCEGPMDALKICLLGADHGIVGTCFFGAGPSIQQVDLLHELLPRFRRRLLVLDHGTTANAMRIQSALASFDVEICSLPAAIKDPAELTQKQMLHHFTLGRGLKVT